MEPTAAPPELLSEETSSLRSSGRSSALTIVELSF
jgi:hypothetical protein